MTCLLFLSWLCSDLDVLTFLLSIVCVCVIFSSTLTEGSVGGQLLNVSWSLVDNCSIRAAPYFGALTLVPPFIFLTGPCSSWTCCIPVLTVSDYNIWVYAGHRMFHIDVFLPSKQLVLFEPSLSNAHALHRCAYVFYGYTVFDSRSTVGASWAWTVVVLLWCPANCWSPTPPFHRAREYAVNHTAFILIRGCDVIA